MGNGTEAFYLTSLLFTDTQMVVSERKLQAGKSLGSDITMKTCMRSLFIPNFRLSDVIPFRHQTGVFLSQMGWH